MTFVPELVTMLNGLEAELRQGDISAANQQWLAQCRLTPEQIKTRWSRNIYSREKSTCTTATTGGCCGADLNGQISEMYRRKITNKLHSGTAPHLFITYHY